MEKTMISPFMKYKDTFSELLGSDNVVIFVHRSPDGDALGSAFALKRLLENGGKRVCVVSADEVPKNMTFICDGAARLDPEFEPDTVVSVDVATAAMLGTSYEKYADKVDFCIDHHITNSLYAKKTILFPDASSAGEVLFGLMKVCGCEIDDYIAEKLYSAISFDTGCFKFSNVRPFTFIAAAELISHGFDASYINRRLFDLASVNRLRMENVLLCEAETYFEGRLAISCISQKMLRKNGLTDADTEGMSSLLRRIDGTDISYTVRELEDGSIRVSLRSEGDFDVSAVASLFGGGGHKRASGCSFAGDIAAAKKSLLDETARRLGCSVG